MRTISIPYLICYVCLFSSFGLAQETVAIQPGSRAPKLSVDQWITESDNPSKATLDIEPDKIHVVEFWCTTCDGSIPALMQLGYLKDRYSLNDVRFSLISHETPQKIHAFLKSSSRTPSGQSIPHQQLAASIAIGSDSDRSSHNAYLGKENIGQLPWAFLIGRNGTVEWHGHPSELEEVLDAIVHGRWDRTKMEQDQKLMAEIQESIARLSKVKDWKNAILELDRFLALTDDPRIQFGLLKSKIEIYARSGNSSPEIAAVVEQLFKICGEEPLFAHDVANTVYQLAIRGHLKESTAIRSSVDGVTRAINQVEDGSTKSGMLHTLAKLEGLLGRTEQAIAHQKMSIELADESQKPTLHAFLAKLSSQVSAPR